MVNIFSYLEYSSKSVDICLCMGYYYGMRFNHTRLAELMKGTGHTVRSLPLEFYEKTGKRVSYQALQNWSKGFKTPLFDNVLNLCKYFEVPITDFIKED